jgi:hypothetical protein
MYRLTTLTAYKMSSLVHVKYRKLPTNLLKNDGSTLSHSSCFDIMILQREPSCLSSLSLSNYPFEFEKKCLHSGSTKRFSTISHTSCTPRRETILRLQYYRSCSFWASGLGKEHCYSPSLGGLSSPARLLPLWWKEVLGRWEDIKLLKGKTICIICVYNFWLDTKLKYIISIYNSGIPKSMTSFLPPQT